MHFTCFHEKLRLYFGLRAVKVGAVGFTSICGRPVRPQELIVPRLSVIPKGWTRALWWCEIRHERPAERSGCDPSAPLADKRRAPSVSQQHVAHLQYVDDFAFFGCFPDQVRGTLVGIKKTLIVAGFPVHEVKACGGVVELLGWLIDGVRGLVSPTSSPCVADLLGRAASGDPEEGQLSSDREASHALPLKWIPLLAFTQSTLACTVRCSASSVLLQPCCH